MKNKKKYILDLVIIILVVILLFWIVKGIEQRQENKALRIRTIYLMGFINGSSCETFEDFDKTWILDSVKIEDL